MIKRILQSFVLLVFLAGFFALAYLVYDRYFSGNSNSNLYIGQFLRNPSANAELSSEALTGCDGAPFIIPTEGFIGLLWRDTAGPYSASRRHTGLDIFSGKLAGAAPIYSVYDGYLTRLDDWQSTVVIKHDDPLQAGRTIWTYYTHMANKDGETIYIAPEFPQGTYNKFVAQGTLLGYQGNYNPPFPIGVHLHISIVTSENNGSFKNEAIIDNTLDPSPYFGLDLNANNQPERPVRCIE